MIYFTPFGRLRHALRAFFAPRAELARALIDLQIAREFAKFVVNKGVQPGDIVVGASGFSLRDCTLVGARVYIMPGCENITVAACHFCHFSGAEYAAQVAEEELMWAGCAAAAGEADA